MNQYISKIVLDSIYFIRRENVWDILSMINPAQWLDRHSLESAQLHNLQKVLSFAFNHIPYYRKIMEESHLHPEDIRSLKDFSGFPILTKETVRANWSILHCGDQNVRSSLRQTSGSTGDPLKILKDRNTTAWMDAAMYRSYAWHGLAPAARQLRIWGSEIGAVGKVRQHLRDILLNRVRFSAFDLEKGKFIKFIGKMKRFEPCFVYGYAQSIYEFANFILRERVDLGHLNFKVVIVTGEMIFEWQKRVISQAFKCPVVNEYGCTEAGIIAIECPLGNMHVLSDVLLVETFQGNGRKDLGNDELLITELNNYFSPLIRYKVGDRARIVQEPCPCGRAFPVLKSLKGRSDDFIVFPSGRKVDPYVVEYIIKNIPARLGAVDQFMIVQTSESALGIKLISNSSNPEKIKEMIKQMWVRSYGSELSVDIQFVIALPKDPSGKISCFKSLKSENSFAGARIA